MLISFPIHARKVHAKNSKVLLGSRGGPCGKHS